MSRKESWQKNKEEDWLHCGHARLPDLLKKNSVVCEQINHCFGKYKYRIKKRKFKQLESLKDNEDIWLDIEIKYKLKHNLI